MYIDLNQGAITCSLAAFLQKWEADQVHALSKTLRPIQKQS
jgi:hypothetical protein